MNKNAKQNLKKDLGLWTKGFKSGVKMISSDVAWMAGGVGASRVVGGIVKKGVTKAVTTAKANARGLKAAQGKSLAPKGYKPDAEGRAVAKTIADKHVAGTKRKTAVKAGAEIVDHGRRMGKIKPAPVNPVKWKPPYKVVAEPRKPKKK